MSRNRKTLLLSLCPARFALMGLIVCLISHPVLAEPKTLTGVAYVSDAKTLTLEGQQIVLWGLDTLALDQQCWQDNNAWMCGEEALMALKHFTDGKTVTCEIQHPADNDGPASGKCFRHKGSAKIDIAEHMIGEGWALERGEASGGVYFKAEQNAQNAKKGVWGSRFQTAQDWRDGIQRFVGDEDQPTGEE